MEVRAISTDREYTRAFIDFPDELYREDNNYIRPSFRANLSLARGEDGLHREYGTIIRNFAAWDGHEVIGRVSAFFNPRMKSAEGEGIGCLGLWECRSDISVSNALLGTACEWFNKEYGMSRIWGPVNGSIWHGYRCMTLGFDKQVFVGEPYNLPYYADMFTQFGFRVLQEWDTLFVHGVERIEKMIARGADRLDFLCGQGYRFEPFRKERRNQQVADLHEVLSKSYRGFVGFTSTSLASFDRMFQRWEPVLDPDLFLLTYDPSGACVGFGVAFPDYPEAARALAGRSSLLGNTAWLRHLDAHPRLNFYIGGVLPEMERVGAGLGRAGFYCIIRAALDKGYDTVMLTLRVKGNRAHALAVRSGLTAQHEYALYEYHYEP